MRFCLGFCLLLAFESCTKVEDISTTLEILRIDNRSENVLDSLTVRSAAGLDYRDIIKGRLDSSGRFTTNLDVIDPNKYFVQVGESYFAVFLRPGDHVSVTLTVDTSKVSKHFACSDPNNNIGHINNYLHQTQEIFGRVRNLVPAKTIPDFLTTFDSLTLSIQKTREDFLDSVSLAHEEIDMLEKLNSLQLLDVKLWYTFRIHNDFLVEQIYALQEGKKASKYKTPEGLLGILNEVPLEEELLVSPFYQDLYQTVLWEFAEEKYKNPYFNPARWDKPDPNQLRLFWNAIKAERFPNNLTEYILASDLNNHMLTLGVSPLADSVYQDFQREFNNSKYAASLTRTYDQQTKILPGTDAHDITGTKVDGSIIKLSNFKNKIVYVDVWATWCGPCVAEIPFAKQVHQKFEKNEEVVFLNISVDRDVEAWKKKVAGDPEWKGIHINLSPNETDSLYTNYRIVGIPKYFLIDRAGKIANARAPRPSSNEVIIHEIEKFLDAY
ncbi:MAG: TlpA disulfide reductase family protein [Cyclobacteriaceae bacterium]